MHLFRRSPRERHDGVVPNFWSFRRILATIAVVPWAYLLWSGYDLCFGPHAQAVTGYPNQGQVHLYVVLPAAGLVIALALFVLANRVAVWFECLTFFMQLIFLITV